MITLAQLKAFANSTEHAISADVQAFIAAIEAEWGRLTGANNPPDPVFGAGPAGVPGAGEPSSTVIAGPAAVGGPLLMPKGGWPAAQTKLDTPTAGIAEAEAAAKAAAEADIAKNRAAGHTPNTGGDFGQV